MIDIRLLGPLEVQDDGGRKVALAGGKPRALLVLLSLRPGEVVASDRLIEDLWPGLSPRSALPVTVSRLRKTLGADVVRSVSPGYVLDLSPEAVDAGRFERLLEEGRLALARGEAARAAATLRDALALWRGPALADVRYETFAQAAIGRLEGLRLVCLEERVEADLALGRAGELVPELEALVAAEPLRERFRAQLMLALYRSGRQAEALAVYQEARRLLVDELGLEPGPGLRELHQSILRQDAQLLPQGTAQAEAPAQAESPPPREAPAYERTRDVRKTVTVLFADLAGSTASGGRLDPEAWRRIQSQYFDAARAALERHGGTVEKFMGDAVMAVFGLPSVHEDDPLRAVRAALEMREEVAALRLGVPLELRIGLDTGEVVAGMGEALVSGDAVNVASRLEQAASPGEILLGELSYRLVRDAVRAEAVALTLRGKAECVPAWRLLELLPDAPALARRLDAPLVGRAEELAQLRSAFARALRERTPYLFTVLGVAGIGKTRLARELTAALAEEAQVLPGRCLSYGEGITFWPLREIVHAAAGEETPDGLAALLEGERDTAAVADALAGALGHAEASSAGEEVFWALAGCSRLSRAASRCSSCSRTSTRPSRGSSTSLSTWLTQPSTRRSSSSASPAPSSSTIVRPGPAGSRTRPRSGSSRSPNARPTSSSPASPTKPGFPPRRAQGSPGSRRAIPSSSSRPSPCSPRAGPPRAISSCRPRSRPSSPCASSASSRANASCSSARPRSARSSPATSSSSSCPRRSPACSTGGWKRSYASSSSDRSLPTPAKEPSSSATSSSRTPATGRSRRSSAPPCTSWSPAGSRNRLPAGSQKSRRSSATTSSRRSGRGPPSASSTRRPGRSRGRRAPTSRRPADEPTAAATRPPRSTSSSGRRPSSRMTTPRGSSSSPT